MKGFSRNILFLFIFLFSTGLVTTLSAQQEDRINNFSLSNEFGSLFFADEFSMFFQEVSVQDELTADTVCKSRTGRSGIIAEHSIYSNQDVSIQRIENFSVLSKVFLPKQNKNFENNFTISIACSVIPHVNPIEYYIYTLKKIII